MVAQAIPSALRSAAVLETEASDECWRPVPGCEGFYSVSNFGRVRSEPIQTSPVGRRRGRILACCPDSKGYPQFAAELPSGRRIRLKVHRAVALAFLGPRPPGHQINHKSGNKLDNCVTNLEYVTCRENIRHAWSNGLYDPEKRRGEKNATAKLTAEKIRQIRAIAPANSLAAVSKSFGVTKQTIWSVIHRKSWQHIR